MESSNPKRQRLISKILSSNWLSQYSNQEIEQEELIKKWQNPDLVGYEGLLAYCELLYKTHKEMKLPKTKKLKKNTPAKIAGVSFSIDQILDFIKQFDPIDSGKISILIQPVLKDIYYGIKKYSIRKLAEEISTSKSSLDRLYQDIKKKYKF